MSTGNLPTFEEVLEDQKDLLGELEAERLVAVEKYEKAKPIRLILIIAAVLFLLSGFVFGNEVTPVIFAVTLFFLVPITFTLFPVLVAKHYDEKNVEFQIVSSLITAFDRELEYLMESNIPAEALSDGGLLFMHYNHTLRGRNYIRGYYRQNYFQCSHIGMGHEEKEYLNFIFGRKPAFNYLIVEFNKTFHSKTIVKQDRLEESMGYLAHKVQNFIKGGTLAKFEHAEFERNFAVFTEDQVEARYILSTKLMEKLLVLNKQFEDGIEVSFENGRMHLLMGQYYPFFYYSFNFQHSIESLYEKVYDELHNLFELVAIFELNQKLWSKQ